MNINLFNKQYLNKKVKLDTNIPNKEGEMLKFMEFWNWGRTNKACIYITRYGAGYKQIKETQ